MIILFEDINENQKGEAHHRTSSTSPPNPRLSSSQGNATSFGMFAALGTHLKAIFRKSSASSIVEEIAQEKIAP